jgi:hypothetical protein
MQRKGIDKIDPKPFIFGCLWFVGGGGDRGVGEGGPEIQNVSKDKLFLLFKMLFFVKNDYAIKQSPLEERERKTEREKDRERERQRERKTEREKERERERKRETEREKDRERERQRVRKTEIGKYRKTEKET